MNKDACEIILKKNRVRTKLSNRIYNPYNGIGSPLTRIKLKIDKNDYLLIPEKMRCNEEIKKKKKLEQ